MIEMESGDMVDDFFLEGYYIASSSIFGKTSKFWRPQISHRLWTFDIDLPVFLLRNPTGIVLV